MQFSRAVGEDAALHGDFGSGERDLNIIQTTLKRSAFVALLAVGIAQGAFAAPVNVLTAYTGNDSPFIWDNSALSLTSSTSMSLNRLEVENAVPIASGQDADGWLSLSSLKATYVGTSAGLTYYNLTPSLVNALGVLKVGYKTSTWEVDFNRATLIEGANSITLSVLASKPAFGDQFVLKGFTGSYVDESLTISLTKTSGKSYGGSVSLSAEAVPEPVTLLLGIASIGGFVARRRSQKA